MSLEQDRMPCFVNVTRRADSEEYIREAAGRVGLTLAAFHTDVEAGVAAFVAEAKRLSAPEEPFRQTAEALIRQGGAVYHLVADPPEAGISDEQIEEFNRHRAALDPSWRSPLAEE